MSERDKHMMAHTTRGGSMTQDMQTETRTLDDLLSDYVSACMEYEDVVEGLSDNLPESEREILRHTLAREEAAKNAIYSAVRQAKADAWDELYSSQYDGAPGGHEAVDPNNPYREEAGA